MDSTKPKIKQDSNCNKNQVPVTSPSKIDPKTDTVNLLERDGTLEPYHHSLEQNFYNTLDLH